MNDKTKLLTKDIKPREGEMIKPAEIIGIAGIEGWSLADRRTWNLLLANAWLGDRLEDPTADFEIPLRELRGLHDSNDRIRDSLERLQKTLVRAHMPNSVTRTVQMLGGTDMADDDRATGILRYDFHRKLVPLLRKSEIYARMEIKVLSAFTSKYSLALYEVIAGKIALRKSSEEITVETLRQWFGIERGKLARYPDLNRFAIMPALQEVNGLSPFEVSIEPIKRGRKVERFTVSWAKKEPYSPAEQAAAREVNRSKIGRGARLAGSVEDVVTLPPDAITKGWEMAGGRQLSTDKYGLANEYHEWAKSLPDTIENPVGHFFDYCRKRARKV